MPVDSGGGKRKVSNKPLGKTPVQPPVKTSGLQPSPQKRTFQQTYLPGTGRTPTTNTGSKISAGAQARIADLSAKAPQYIVPYTPPADSIGSVAYNPWLGARGKYGDVLTQTEWNELTPELKNKYNMGYTVIPEGTAAAGPAASSGYARRPYGGGGGGGGGTVAPPIPEMKIRSQPGIRRSPYWESDDPYNQVFEPRFVVLGNANAW